LNLHGIATGAINAINPGVYAGLYESVGNTTAADGTRSPAYNPVVYARVQMQPMTEADLRLVQTSNVNLQDVTRAFYIRGNAQGIVRPFSKGGDLIQVNGSMWLVVQVLETWPDWSKVAATLQRDATPPAAGNA
jgi:hypothetical protein